MAAKSAMLRVLRANGFAIIPWRVLRVLIGEMREKGRGIIRRVLHYDTACGRLCLVRAVAQHLQFDEANTFADAEIGIVQKLEENPVRARTRRPRGATNNACQHG